MQIYIIIILAIRKIMKQVYKITNIKNNKSYIGIVIARDKDYLKRFQEHMTGKGGVYLWNELKSGSATVEDFVVELLEEGNQDDLYFKTQEEFYIEYLGTLWPNGYNGNKGNYIVKTPEILQKARKTRFQNHQAGLHKSTGRSGMAIYRYPDGSIKKLSINHPDVLNNTVKHINYNPECKTRLLEQEIAEQKERNNGLTDKQVAWKVKIAKLAKQYPNLESWQHGREKFKERMAMKDFTEKEKELYYERRSKIVKANWDSMTPEQRLEKCGPGLRARNARKVCPHCGIETNLGNYTRWHGDNCKKASAT